MRTLSALGGGGGGVRTGQIPGAEDQLSQRKAFVEEGGHMIITMMIERERKREWRMSAGIFMSHNKTHINPSASTDSICT